MAQPPLSVAIRKLEEEIGVVLFERGSRGVRLTEAGRVAFDMAQQCLARAEDVVVATRAAANGEQGRLRIGCIGSVMHQLMPACIRAFRKRYPLVKLELRETVNKSGVMLVQTNELDVAFVRLPAICPAGLTFSVVQEGIFCVALPARHPLCDKPALSMSDIATENFIGYLPSWAGGGLQAGVARLLQTAKIAPNIVQEAVQIQTVIGLVQSGLGIALVPAASINGASNGVEFRPIADHPAIPAIGIALAHSTACKNAAVTRFLECVERIAPDFSMDA